jgi:hypothetical protein
VSGTTRSPQPISASQRSWIPALAASLLAPGVLAAALYGIARQGYVEFYQVLGLAPEQVGLSQWELAAQVGTLLGLLVLLALSYIAVIVFGYHVTTAARPPGTPPTEGRKAALLAATVVLVPLIVVVAVARLVPRSSWLFYAGRAAVLISAGIAWTALATPIAGSGWASKKYRASSTAIVLIALAVASIVTHGGIRQTLWYTFLVFVVLFGLFAAYLHEGPAGPKLRY